MLAARLLFHSSNAFARFVTWVSFIGLLLGVMILTVVVSVMNGFDGELRSRLLSTIPHVTVATQALNQNQQAVLPEEVAVSKYFQGLGAINSRGRVFPLTLYGIDPQVGLQTGLLKGVHENTLDRLRADPDGIVLGTPVARWLRAQPGDPVRIMTVDVRSGSAQPRVIAFRLAGSFEFGAETDYSLAIVNTDKLSPAEWQGMGDYGIQIQLADPMDARAVVAALESVDQNATIASWETQFGELFQAVQLEKSMMFLLLLLVVAIAAFNIIAGQSMLVEDKRQNIAILRTMGATSFLIRALFFYQGAIVSLVGTLIGLGLGVLSSLYINEIMSLVETLSGMHLLDGSFFVRIPVRVDTLDLLVISAMSLVICLTAALLPAQRAAKLDPVASLH